MYFQGSDRSDTTYYPLRQPYPLQPGDLLSIKFSGPDPVALAPFGTDNTAQSNAQASNTQLFVQGYSISDSGFVQVPVLGKIQAGGRTVAQVDQEVQQMLNQFVKNAVSKVRMVSFKISVLGEVRNPNTLYVYNDKLTILEALGYAGDLTDAANRQRIKLIRSRFGKVNVYTIDITSKRLLGSDLFYLQPNDVLYVEPIGAKTDRLNLPTLSILLSAATTVLVLVSIILSLRK